MKHKKSSFLFSAVNGVFFGLVGLVCLVPWLHVIAKSFSGQGAVVAGKVGLWPIDFQVQVYRFVLLQSGFAQALRISLFVTVVGTLVSLLMTTMAAYPLSKTYLKGRKAFVLIFVFAMLFYGGIVPNYLLMKSLGLVNTVWSMIVPFMIVPFNLFIMKTFLEGIPEALEESAKIDGAGNMRILFHLVLPISLPSLATIGLFYAVNYWNDYFHPLMYISDPKLKPLQLYLYDMITSIEAILKEGDADQLLNLTSGNAQAATIILSALPIVALYPFLQKYFVKGMTIGSVKG